MPESGEPENPYDWLIGVVLYVVAAVIVNLGNNLVKLGHSMAIEEALTTPTGPTSPRSAPKVDKEPEFWSSRRLAWVGWSTYTSAGLLNFASFAFGTQSMLSTLAAVQFVSNLFLAWLINGEKPTIRIVGGTLLICVGIVGVILTGPRSNDACIEDCVLELLEAYGQRNMIIWMCTSASLFLVAEFFRTRLGRKLRNPEKSVCPCVSAARCPCCMPSPSSTKTITGLLFGFTSASVGAHSTLFMKSLAEISRLAIEGSVPINILALGVAAVLLVLLICTTAFWIYRLNIGLKTYSALFIVPVMQINWTVIAIIEGAVYFDEFKGDQLNNIIDQAIFGGAIALIFVGVYFISNMTHQNNNGHRYEPIVDADEEEHTEDLSVEDLALQMDITPGVITPDGVQKLSVEGPSSILMKRYGMHLTLSTFGVYQVQWMQEHGFDHVYKVARAAAMDGGATLDGRPRSQSESMASDRSRRRSSL